MSKEQYSFDTNGIKLLGIQNQVATVKKDGLVRTVPADRAFDPEAFEQGVPTRDPEQIHYQKESRVLRRRGKVALVQYGNERRLVPIEEVRNAEAFDVGMSWGVPWEEIQLSADSERLAAELRRRGIWTLADLEKNRDAAFGAIQATYGVDLSKLFAFARKFEEV